MNDPLVYTPTLMEKLLGNWYKYYYFLSYNIITAQAGIYSTAVAQVSNFVNSFMIVYLWTTNNANSQIITYLILGQLYRNIIQTFWNERIGGEIISGKITNLLLVPHGYLNYHFFCKSRSENI